MKQDTLKSFTLLPKDLVSDGFKSDKCVQLALFKHVQRFVSRAAGGSEEKNEVSQYLDVEVSRDQQRLLNPTTLDTVEGYIMKDAMGEGAKRRLPQRRLNLIDGSISSHSAVLNNPVRLKLIKEANELAAVLADIETDKQAEKAKRKAAAIEKDKEKKETAAAREEADARKEKEGLRESLKLLEVIDREKVGFI